MQFPVPQFTDVEDKIIGSLTIKQFGILFGVGIVIFLGYSVSKSILVAIFLFLLFGVPGLGVAFAKINGRPIYSSIGNFIKFFTSPKVLIFHKETVSSSASTAAFKDAQMAAAEVKVQAPVPAENTQTHLKQVEELLRKTSNQEQEMANKIR